MQTTGKLLSALVMVAATVTSPAFAQDELGRKGRARIEIEWAEHSTKNYVIAYEKVIPRSAVNRVATGLEAVLAEYKKVFKFKPKGKMAVKFLDSINTYEQEGGDPSHPGIYFPGSGHLIIRQLPFYKLIPTVYHEAFHQYLHRYMGDVNIPIWFNEGMATYFEGIQTNKKTKKLDNRLIDNRKIVMVQQALLTRTAIPLEQLIDSGHEEFHDKDKESLHYMQSFSVVYFLMHGFGTRKALKYAEALKKTGDPEEANKVIFGKERRKLKSLEKKWKSFTRRVKLTDGTQAS